MRYTVDVAELRRAVDLVARAVWSRRGSVSRHLEGSAAGLPHGATARALPDLVARWRARERRVESGLIEHAEHLGVVVAGYEHVEANARGVFDEGRT